MYCIKYVSRIILNIINHNKKNKLITLNEYYKLKNDLYEYEELIQYYIYNIEYYSTINLTYSDNLKTYFKYLINWHKRLYTFNDIDYNIIIQNVNEDINNYQYFSLINNDVHMIIIDLIHILEYNKKILRNQIIMWKFIKKYSIKINKLPFEIIEIIDKKITS